MGKGPARQCDGDLLEMGEMGGQIRKKIAPLADRAGPQSLPIPLRCVGFPLDALDDLPVLLDGKQIWGRN
jgi:hypothetical protein